MALIGNERVVSNDDRATLERHRVKGTWGDCCWKMGK